MEAKLTMERVLELDGIRSAQVQIFLQMGEQYGSPLPLFLYEEYSGPGQLKVMARRWKVPLPEFLAYVRLQTYISALAQDAADWAALEREADVLGIPVGELSSYVRAEVELVREALAPDEDDIFEAPLLWDDDMDFLQEAGRR